MIREYLIQEKLGIGSYGTVYKAIKKNDSNENTIYVIKQISLFGLSKEEINDVKLEAKILSSIKSIYVVKYLESFEEKNFLNIVMEYCDGGDLGKFIEENRNKNKYINEDLIWKLFIKICLGLAAIHKLKILHRDLKTLNIFLTKNLDVKIGDLGVAKVLSHSGCFAKTLIGTPYYLSPELCEEKPYNDKSDVWALGCILYELCTYKHPFNAKSQGALILKILKDEPEPIGNNYSNELQKLINDILEKNIERRPSCKDLLKKDFIVEKAKEFGLYNKIVELYPELKENMVCDNNKNINIKMNTNCKIIYNKNRYPRYKVNNVIQKNNSISKIDISNINIKNQRNFNIYKKNNKIKSKSQFNSISTDSHSHNSIKNILIRNNGNNENEPKDNQRNKLKYKNGANIIYDNNKKVNNGNTTNNNIVNNDIIKNINIENKLFIKKPLNQFPLSAYNKNVNSNNGNNRNSEYYNNFLNKKEIKSINTSTKSAKKKIFINLNNNSKSNLMKNYINLRTNKSEGKNFIVLENPTDFPKKEEISNFNFNNRNNSNNNDNKHNIRYVNLNKYLNKNHVKTNSNININNIKDENKENGKDNNYDIKIENKNQIDINKSIENFENKLKNYYQYSPEIKPKKTSFIYNHNKNNIKTPSKVNNISDNILYKLSQIDIIDTNGNNPKNAIEFNFNKNNNGKNNGLMEFIKYLNDYVPQYKINNQTPNDIKRTKNKSKSVCENDNLVKYNNIQKQINNNKIVQKQNNYFCINNNSNDE